MKKRIRLTIGGRVQGVGFRPRVFNHAVACGLSGSVINTPCGVVVEAEGDHGVTVMNAREDLELQSNLVSDVASLSRMALSVLAAVPGVHCFRDPTRGGVAAALCDIAGASGCCIRIREVDLLVRDEVKGACSLLGLDPLSVANEGKMLIVCSEGDEQRVLEALKSDELGRDACRIGRVLPEPVARVIMETRIGGERIVDIPVGEDLPRIC